MPMTTADNINVTRQNHCPFPCMGSMPAGTGPPNMQVMEKVMRGTRNTTDSMKRTKSCKSLRDFLVLGASPS